jgi:hypothetical protein
MLHKLKNEMAECYQRALECRRWADESSDPDSKQDFRDMERRWIQLAHNYEFAERLSNFTEPFSRRKSRGAAHRKRPDPPLPGQAGTYRPRANTESRSQVAPIERGTAARAS